MKNRINDLHATGDRSTMIAVGWNDDAGNRHHVWLKVEKDPERPGRNRPVRPFQPRPEYNRNRRDFSDPPILYRNCPLKPDGSFRSRYDDGHFPTRKLSAAASANKPVVDEALRRAEAEGLWEKAVAEAEEEKAAQHAEALAKRLAGIRRGLNEWQTEGPEGIEAQVIDQLLFADDDQLLRIADRVAQVTKQADL